MALNLDNVNEEVIKEVKRIQETQEEGWKLLHMRRYSFIEDLIEFEFGHIEDLTLYKVISLNVGTGEKSERLLRKGRDD